MRIVEPRQFNHLKKNGSKKRKNPLPFILIPIIAGGLWYGWQHPPKLQRQVTPAPTIQKQEEILADANSSAPKTLKTFTGEDFKNLFRSLAHPNTQIFPEPPEITGNKEADKRIRSLAEARGYRMTSIPVGALVKITEDTTPNGDDLFQPLANQGWLELKTAAKNANIPLALYSAYRSPEFQRELFLSRLTAAGATPERIAAGQADAIVKATLEITAVPGYSRHHGGYTADFMCEDGSANFGVSVCFTWLNKDNYKNAKEYGWIPSYPEEAKEQGPEPEPWEYVWVGRDTLTQ